MSNVRSAVSRLADIQTEIMDRSEAVLNERDQEDAIKDLLS